MSAFNEALKVNTALTTLELVGEQLKARQFQTGTSHPTVTNKTEKISALEKRTALGMGGRLGTDSNGYGKCAANDKTTQNKDTALTKKMIKTDR